MRRSITLALVCATMLLASGCNTISGAGRDLSSVGKAVTETANDVKN